MALDIDTREPLLQYYIQPFCIICVLHYLNLILVSAAVSEFSEIFSPLSYLAFSRFRVFMPAIERKKYPSGVLFRPIARFHDFVAKGDNRLPI